MLPDPNNIDSKDYVPLKPHVPPHQAYNALGLAVSAAGNSDASDILPATIVRRFYSYQILQDIVEHTNMYAISKINHSNGRICSTLSTAELKVWLVITWLMGVVHAPAIRDF